MLLANAASLVESLGNTLEGSDFERGASETDEGEWSAWRWTRRPAAWREEVVELLIRRPEQDRALVNLIVYVQEGESRQRIDGRSLSSFGSEMRSIDLREGLLGRWGASRTVKVATRDLIAGLTWFLGFSTVDKCTQKVRGGETNLGSGEAARRVLEMLQEVAPEEVPRDFR